MHFHVIMNDLPHYIIAPMHQCMFMFMFMVFKQTKTLINIKEIKQDKTNRQILRDMKNWIKQRLNRWKKARKNKKKWIRVFGHECACAYIGYACVSQLYAYAHFEYAYACMKHAHTYTPETLTQKLRTKKIKNKK